MRWVLVLYYGNYKDDNEELVTKTPSCQFRNRMHTNNKNYKLQSKYDRWIVRIVLFFLSIVLEESLAF